jgi:hypothetical protein
MAIDTSTLEATLQAKFDAVTDPKEMLLLGKAYESTVGGIAVSDIEDAGAAQVATINQVATNTFKTVGGTSILGTGDIATLPSQTGYSGKVLSTNGTTASWQDAYAPGSVVQVQQGILRNAPSGGGKYVNVGLQVSITPKYSNSKILISGSLIMGTGGTSVGGTLYRNGSVLTGAVGDASGSRPRTTTGESVDSGAWYGAMAFEYLDDAGTTSTITYNMYVGSHDGRTWSVNRSTQNGNNNELDNQRTISTIIVKEIKV